MFLEKGTDVVPDVATSDQQYAESCWIYFDTRNLWLTSWVILFLIQVSGSADVCFAFPV